MAIAKVILNGEVQMDVTSDTVEANKLLSGETATKNDGTKVTGTFVAPDPVISSLSVTPTESEQTFNEASISGYKPVTVGAIASDYVGSAVPMRSDVNLTGLETYSGYKVQAQQGYYSQTASYNISAASINISGPYFTYSLGYFSGAVNIITSGYTKQSSYSFSQQLSTLSSQTITPSSESQYIPANRWLTGSQTIAPINITSLSVTPTEEQQVFNETAKSLVQTGSSVAGSTERPTLSLVVGKQYILRLIDATATNGYSCIDSIDEKEYTFTWAGQEITHRFQGYGSNRISIRITEKNTIFISSYSGIEDISWELYVENMVDGYLPVTVNAIPSSYIIPSGTYSVTENGTYDIGSYASVDVSVSGGDNFEDALVMRTLTSYENSRVSYVGSGAFYGAGLTTISLPNVERLDSVALAKNNLRSTVSFPKLKRIGYYAFSAAYSLTHSGDAIRHMDIGLLCPELSQIDQYGLNGGSFYSATLPKVTSLVNGCFRDCEVRHYNLPNLQSIPNGCFYSADILTCASVDFKNVTTIGDGAFSSCRDLTYVNFSKVSVIGSAVFSFCTSLNSVSLPLVELVPDYAFYNCYSLTYIDMPLVTSIGKSAFCGTGLSTLSFSYCTSIGDYAFAKCSKIETISLPALTYLGNCAIQSNPWFSLSSTLSSIYFPNVSYIGSFNFTSCYMLSGELSFSKLEEINQYAFESCSSITAVYAPLLNSMGTGVFASCSSLISVFMPNVSYIPNYAFSNCINLSNIVCENVTSIGGAAFARCRSLNFQYFSNLVTIGRSAFSYNDMLASVIAPKLTAAPSYAFYSCINLSIVKTDNLTTIDISAFFGCRSLFSIYLLGESVVSLYAGSVGIFGSTPIVMSSLYGGSYGSIFVPASLYDSYIVASRWSDISSRIVGLTDEQMDPIIHCGSVVYAGRMTDTTVSYGLYTGEAQFSSNLPTGSSYVLFDILKYKDTNGSYHLIANTPGVSFVASVNESLPHKSTGDVTYAVGAAFDHAAFLWQLPDGITDVSEVICDYTICEYNA